ncbi:MAG: lactate racemase domain-containing protein, partial [Vulcanimicrobiaceae bacterium]
MKIHAAYGRAGIDVQLPDATAIIEPLPQTPLADEHSAFQDAVRHPIGARPLREAIAPTDRVVIVTSDITRATPNERLIPWILGELAHVAPANITVIIGTGSHRATTAAEMEQMFGASTLARVRVIDHDAHDPSQVSFVGTTSRGANVYLNSQYLKADKRIVV